MYFNGNNNTNIDDEFGNTKKSIFKRDNNKGTTEKKNFHFTQDTLLMCFYGFLLIIGIILIIISIR